MAKDDWILKLIVALIKRTLANLKTIRSMFNTKEKYILLSVIIISFCILYYYKAHWGLYLLVFIFYFFIKSIFQEMKEKAVTLKYKGITKLFDNKVKVIAVTKDGNYLLNSFVPVKEIEKKKYEIEHYLNREITKIERNKSNFRHITIKTKSNTKTKLKAKYRLSDYIKTVDIKKKKIPFMLGVKEKEENFIVGDLKKFKNIMISGESGGGKSTLVNTIVQSLMYFNSNISFFLIDFKRVELNVYKQFKNCLFCKDHKNFLDLLENLNKEMDSRYDKLEKRELSDIEQYNKLITDDKLPYIVIIIDEIADIKISLEVDNNRIEELLRRVLNMGRASGIHVIAATQRPSGTQLSTELRAGLISKISFAIQELTTQKMTSVLDTKDLGTGEFKTSNMGFCNEEVIKGFWVDRVQENKVYEELKNLLVGGVNLDKND